MDIQALIRELDERAGSGSITSRLEGEAEARRLLDQRAGSFTREDGKEFGRSVNRSRWDGRETHERFMPAFGGGSWAGLLRDLDRFNWFTEKVWTGTEVEALEHLGRVFGDRKVLPWAGTSYPSLLLYLRNPERFHVALQGSLVKGLEALTGERFPLRDEHDYLTYCAAAQAVRAAYQLTPQGLDLLLWGASGPAQLSWRSSPEPVGERVAR